MTSPSRAQERGLDVRYEADAACPDQPAFSAIVRGKLTATGVEGAAAAAPQVVVRLRASGAGFVGQLELERADHSKYEREVNGPSCAEVANALAFVLALALGAKDPTTASMPVPTATSPMLPPPLPASLTTTAAAAASPPLVASPRVPAHPVAQRRSAWSFGGGAGLGARAGLGPNWALVESAFLEARRASASPFALTLRAGFENAPPSSSRNSNGSTDFSWWAGKAEACPVRLRLLEPLELQPCAGVHVGRLQASGQPDQGVSRTQSKIWFDGLAALRLELSVLRWLALGVQGEMLVPFTPYLFVFDGPTTPVYQVPHLASAGFLGLAGHFP